MSLLTMPMIIINLGAEMLYILEQRLNAQGIANDKGSKVLTDITTCMFNGEYMKVLFRPQEMYSLAAVRKIFERMAHSSIMRLSETSMDKLYDLMVMGFKYQLVCSCALDTMMQVTYTHLSQLRQMVSPLPDAAPCLAMLDHVQEQVHTTYGNLGIGALHLLRQTLLRFFQDRRIKVSLFLQEGIQSTSGRLILHNPNGPRVGCVTYYDSAGGVEAQERRKLSALEVEPVEFFIHPTQLGVNLYSGKRQKVAPPARKGDALTAPLLPSDDLLLAGAAEAKSQYAEDYRAASKGVTARQELGLLSALLAIKPQTDNFRLNLFEDGDGPGSPGRPRAPGATSVQLGQVESLQFSQARDAYKAGMMAALKLDEPTTGTKQQEGEEEDLLDLLGE